MGPAARLGDYALTSRGLMEAKEAYFTAVEVHVVPVLTMNTMVLRTPCGVNLPHVDQEPHDDVRPQVGVKVLLKV